MEVSAFAALPGTRGAVGPQRLVHRAPPQTRSTCAPVESSGHGRCTGSVALAAVALVSQRRGRRTPGLTAAQATATATVAPAAEAPVESPSVPRKLPQAAPACSAPAWRERFWFPVASLLELDPLRPTPVRIDGLDLVVWCEPGDAKAAETDAGRWHVFLDACPHRLAPLSEGRVEPSTGCLQCAYHGWEFEGKGCCTRIPQVSEEDGKRMRANPRASATALPTEVALSCLWVWLGEGSPVGSPSALASGTYIEDMDIAATYTRDVPYGYDSLLENFVDVSHIPFAHHGLQGTRDDAKPIAMTVPEVQLTADGVDDGDLLSFSFEDRTMGKDRQASFQLRSPFLFAYDGVYDEGKVKEEAAEDSNKFHSSGGRFRLSICCVPVGPGHSRMIILNPRKRNEPASGAFALLPRWIVHLLSNRFIDSDLAFLHFQERNLRRFPDKPADWKDGYFMPADSDRSIGAWRQWLAREGALCVLPGPALELPQSPERQELLDRYSQHTAHCKHCQEGLRTLDTMKSAAIAVGLLALLLDRVGLGPQPLWLILQVLAVAVLVGVERIRQEFYFVDYQHYKT